MKTILELILLVKMIHGKFVSPSETWSIRISSILQYNTAAEPETIPQMSQTLRQHFHDHSFLFNARYRCLKLVMIENDDFLTHVGTVNRECEKFKLKSITDDQFKSLILICSLQSPKFADIRM
ncbi:unnamed protein product [Heterobilharzia americana]|nr:unnamed protein product [Heterobilharzia americana]CAH8442140.1 unnamed protein product [Heterobilharzia americana]